MSAWHSQFLALELASPLHLGYRASGNLKQTRRYVPGRALWGAIIERSARSTGAQTSAAFDTARSHVEKYFRFTCAFPSTGKDRVSHWPWSQREEFDWKFLQSYAGTALIDGRSKLDGSLHETEYIAPVTRDRETVYLLLCLWRRDDAKALSFYPDPLAEPFWAGAQIGGEKGYGWGRIRRAHTIPGGVLPFLQAAGWNPQEPDNGKIIITPTPAAQPRFAIAHVLPAAVAGSWIGRVEPIVGRQTADDRPGHSLHRHPRLRTRHALSPKCPRCIPNRTPSRLAPPPSRPLIRNSPYKC